MKSYQPLKWDLQERVKRVWGNTVIEDMKKDIIELLQTYSKLLNSNIHAKSEDFPIVKITIDNDFDGYSSAKQVYHFFSTLGISNEYIEFIPLNNHGKEDQEIRVRKQDLLVVTDASLLNIKHNNEGKVWWIDHHAMNIQDRIRTLSLQETRILVSRNTNDERLKGLSAGLFTHIIMYTLIEELNVSLENYYEDNTKLDALMSMISDMMPIEEYRGMYMGILESKKPNFYEESKTVWDKDNKSYFNKYTSKINNLIRMERFDLIEYLIQGKGGEFIKRDIDRMEEDRKKLMNTYFQPLKPIYLYEGKDSLVQLYQVPMESNNIMRNHKGLLASMKTPKEIRKWITLARMTEDIKYNYSVRTNTDGNLHKYLKQELKGVEVGGHLRAFGISIYTESEDKLIQKLINYINLENIKGETKRAVNLYELEDKGPLKEVIWNMATENERKIEPDRIRFKREDFKEIKVHQKRTVYLLELSPTESYEIVSFDLHEKDEIIATPLCKGGIFEKYKVDILERG